MNYVYGTFPEKVIFASEKTKNKFGYYNTQILEHGKVHNVYTSQELIENKPFENVKIEMSELGSYFGIFNDKFSIPLTTTLIKDILQNEGISGSTIKSKLTFGQFKKSIRPIRSGSELENNFKKFSKADPVKKLEANSIYINKQHQVILYLGEFFTPKYTLAFSKNNTSSYSFFKDTGEIEKVKAFINLELLESYEEKYPYFNHYNRLIKFNSGMKFLVKVNEIDQTSLDNLNSFLPKIISRFLNKKTMNLTNLIMLYNRALTKNNVVDKYKKLAMLL